jgi:hypothetical protein
MRHDDPCPGLGSPPIVTPLSGIEPPGATTSSRETVANECLTRRAPYKRFARAYNLANFLRTLALPDAVAQWSLTTLREKLIKIGARTVRHGRYLVFQLAEVAVPRAWFAEILHRIDRLRPRPPPLVA